MPRPSEVRFTPGDPGDRASGLLGFVRLNYGALVLDGLVLRRTLDGRLTLSYPRRKGRGGAIHSIMRPIDDAARRAIEAAVFQALGLDEASR